MEPTTAQPFPTNERAEDEGGRRHSASKFAVVCELGQGGMADVLLAIARGPAGFNKLVVLKQIRGNLARDERFLQMLFDEARLSAQLNHPNIVQTNEVGIDADRHYVAMEYLEGQSLSSVLRRLGATTRELSIGLSLRIAADALAGLHYAHELSDLSGRPLQITHCDVSPHNLFITYAGQVKVLDFGLAKALSSSVETTSGEVRGKLYYMAPEQAAARPVDRRSDIFSLGVVLWEMLTGRPLWSGHTDIAVACHLRFGEIPRITSGARDLPKSVVQVCAKALAFRPEDRFETAADFRAELVAILDELYPRVTNEVLGDLVTELFAQERTEVRGLIEARFAELRAEPSLSEELSVLEQREQPGAGHRAPSPKARWPHAVFLSLTMLTLGALVVALLMIRSQQAPLPAPASSRAARPAATTVTPALVSVEVRAHPEHARIYWDQRPVEGNPFRGRLVADGAIHDIRAEAPGYLPYSTSIRLSRDATLDFALTALPSARVRKTARPRPRAQPRGTLPSGAQEASVGDEPRAPPPKASSPSVEEFEDPWGGK